MQFNSIKNLLLCYNLYIRSGKFKHSETKWLCSHQQALQVLFQSFI